MEFQLLAMNDSVGLLILVVGMAVAVALIALLESKMNAPQPAASVPEERHAPAAAAKAAPAPAPRAPVVETGVPAEVVAAIAAAVACLEGGAATVRGIRRLPCPAGSRRGVWGEAGIAAVTTPVFVLTPANPGKAKLCLPPQARRLRRLFFWLCGGGAAGEHFLDKQQKYR